MKKHLVILSGAGISKESGIDTFRDKDGIWTKKNAMQLASIEGWNTNPQAVLDFYNARRRQLLSVNPNKAHQLLAALEEWYDVTIITQNVDDLHERAGSTHVIHLHGELSKVCSSANKEDKSCIEQRRSIKTFAWATKPKTVASYVLISCGLANQFQTCPLP